MAFVRKWYETTVYNGFFCSLVGLYTQHTHTHTHTHKHTHTHTHTLTHTLKDDLVILPTHAMRLLSVMLSNSPNALVLT
jgi:hypothetical protein